MELRAPAARLSTTKLGAPRAPAASASASRWPARSPPTPRSCSSTSRSRPSTIGSAGSSKMEIKDLHRADRQDLRLHHPQPRGGDGDVATGSPSCARAASCSSASRCEIYRRPAIRFVAGFMGEVNMIRLERERQRLARPGACARRCPSLRPIRRSPAGWSLRPERLRLLGPARPPTSRSTAIMFNDYVLGSRTQLHARRGERTYIVESCRRGTPCRARASTCASASTSPMPSS